MALAWENVPLFEMAPASGLITPPPVVVTLPAEYQPAERPAWIPWREVPLWDDDSEE